jgi:hypothetical protein
MSSSLLACNTKIRAFLNEIIVPAFVAMAIRQFNCLSRGARAE